MDSRTRTIYPCRLNKGFSFKFLECCLDQHVSDEGWGAQHPEQCDDKKKDKNNSPCVINVNNAFF